MTEAAIVTVNLQGVQYTLQVLIPVKKREIPEKELERRAINLFHTAVISGVEIQRKRS